MVTTILHIHCSDTTPTYFVNLVKKYLKTNYPHIIKTRGQRGYVLCINTIRRGMPTRELGQFGWPRFHGVALLGLSSFLCFKVVTEMRPVLSIGHTYWERK